MISRENVVHCPLSLDGHGDHGKRGDGKGSASSFMVNTVSPCLSYSTWTDPSGRKALFALLPKKFYKHLAQGPQHQYKPESRLLLVQELSSTSVIRFQRRHTCHEAAMPFPSEPIPSHVLKAHPNVSEALLMSPLVEIGNLFKPKKINRLCLCACSNSRVASFC